MTGQDDDALSPVSIAKIFEIALAISMSGSKDAFLAECAKDGHHVFVSNRTKTFTLQYMNRRTAGGDATIQAIQTGGCTE